MKLNKMRALFVEQPKEERVVLGIDPGSDEYTSVAVFRNAEQVFVCNSNTVIGSFKLDLKELNSIVPNSAEIQIENRVADLLSGFAPRAGGLELHFEDLKEMTMTPIKSGVFAQSRAFLTLSESSLEDDSSRVFKNIKFSFDVFAEYLIYEEAVLFTVKTT